MGFFFDDEAAFHVLNHLGDGDGFFVDVEDGALAETGEDLLEDADEVDGIGGDLLIHAGWRSGAFGGSEVLGEGAESGVRPGRFFDLLLLHEHSGQRL